MKKKMDNENGFILADILVGLFILSLSLLAIGGFYMQNNKASVFTDNRTVAYNWAQERIEDLKSRSDWRGSTDTNPTNPVDNGNDSPPRVGFSRQTTLVYPATIASLPAITNNGTKDTLLTAVNKRLIDTTVTVSWTEKGITQSVSLETLIEHQ